MDKSFMDIFSKQPDEIIDGDYFYHNLWIEEEYTEGARRLGLSLKEQREQREVYYFGRKGISNDNKLQWEIKSVFKLQWERRICQGTIDQNYDRSWVELFVGENVEILKKIALENKPVMDIASSDGMRLASFIMKLNPKIPCLITDIDAHLLKCQRLYINENLTEYNINIASFDNTDIPIKDDSLDYITSTYGVESSFGKPADRPKTYINIYQYSIGKEKAINEVYRILKPDGCFVTIERNMECDYDLQKIYNDYNEYGKLFGIYTYDEIQAVLALLIEEPWRDKFISAGFQVEVEKKYYKKYSMNEVKDFFIILHILIRFIFGQMKREQYTQY